MADALVSARAAREAQSEIGARAAAARRAVGLARLRYEAGYSPYLELLDAERGANAAEVEQVRNAQARLGAAVDLFKALSGGWAD